MFTLAEESLEVTSKSVVLTYECDHELYLERVQEMIESKFCELSYFTQKETILLKWHRQGCRVCFR